MITENKFQSKLIKNIKDIYPLSFVLKNDANYISGFPDLLVLNGPRWAALESKRSYDSSSRPNQAYYVDILNRMSFARKVFPENMEEVLYELQRSFSS